MTLGIGNNPLIIGLGQTGKSCIAYLNNIGRSYHLLDSRSDVPDRQELSQQSLCRSLTFNGLDGDLDFHKQRFHDLTISALIVSPGVAVKGAIFDAARDLKLPILGDVELFARALQQQANAKVIAITGSNGKSTVTQLIYDLMSEAGVSVSMGGNIGIPALELLSNPTEWYVLELSSFQLETTHSLKVDIGTVLNVSEDHMDRYDSFESYRDTKLKLLTMSEHKVIDHDMMPELVCDSAKDVSFGLNGESNSELFWSGSEIHYQDVRSQDSVLEAGQLKLPGIHNIRNIMTSLGILKLAGIPWTESLSAFLYAWPGLEHRCAYVAEINGIRFYNDSKATNVGATKAAIDGFAATTTSPLLLIAGGVGKDADFTVLADTFQQYLKALILLGRDADEILTQAGQDVKSRMVKDMPEAVNVAYHLAESGDTVLLSPACASLDMYPNFEHRGRDFEACVEALQ